MLLDLVSDNQQTSIYLHRPKGYYQQSR